MKWMGKSELMLLSNDTWSLNAYLNYVYLSDFCWIRYWAVVSLERCMRDEDDMSCINALGTAEKWRVAALRQVLEVMFSSRGSW